MVLLDKLMRRLRETGHRVLVFSQVSDWAVGQALADDRACVLGD
jgi:hypothetical protein